MKRLVLSIALLSFIATSCTSSEETIEITCGSTTPSYATDVVPVLQQKCISCHSDAMPRGNVSLGSYTKVYTNKSATRNIFASSTAHEGVSLTTAERNTVCCWIDSNAPNN